MFVHLIDSSGRLVAQNDSEPIAWRSPTDGWQPGERYTDSTLGLCCLRTCLPASMC